MVLGCVAETSRNTTATMISREAVAIVRGGTTGAARKMAVFWSVRITCVPPMLALLVVLATAHAQGLFIDHSL